MPAVSSSSHLLFSLFPSPPPSLWARFSVPISIGESRERAYSHVQDCYPGVSLPRSGAGRDDFDCPGLEDELDSYWARRSAAASARCPRRRHPRPGSAFPPSQRTRRRSTFAVVQLGRRLRRGEVELCWAEQLDFASVAVDGVVGSGLFFCVEGRRCRREAAARTPHAAAAAFAPRSGRPSRRHRRRRR